VGSAVRPLDAQECEEFGHLIRGHRAARSEGDPITGDARASPMPQGPEWPDEQIEWRKGGAGAERPVASMVTP
jgi:hypothetical protein